MTTPTEAHSRRETITSGETPNETPREAAGSKKFLQFERVFSTEGISPYDQVTWKTFSSTLTDESGKVLHSLEVEAPDFYTQSAVDIISSKYFRRAGVPQTDAEQNPILDEDGQPILGGETSMRQVVHRLAGCWADWGMRYGYFDTDSAKVFYDEIAWLLLHQYFAPNSPQWFNTGLFWAYGIDNTSQKRYFFNPETGEVEETNSRYQRPEPMACFLSHISDSLTDPAGIADFVGREMRIFQAGAGSGANFSSLRASGEQLSGGGMSSGMMSFLKVFDRSAGAIKSGGTTRRAAKMVVVDADHPEVEEFIDWKRNEEKKVAALVAAGYDSDWRGEAYQTVSGQNANNSVSVSHEFMKALEEDADWQLTARTDGSVMKTVKARDLWRKIAEAAHDSADPGIQFNGIMNDWNPVPHVGRIRTTNPCSEAMQVDDSACNLASLRLTAFLTEDGGFATERFVAASKLVETILEISVSMAQFPDEKVAHNTYHLRYTGLGYADLGALLMRMGLPYDSHEGRQVAATITSLMTAAASVASAEVAAVMGPYGFYDAENHLRVIRNHMAAHEGAAFDGLAVEPQTLDPEALPAWAQPIFEAGSEEWRRAVLLGDQYGFRNAQTTLQAPTGCLVGGTLVTTDKGLLRLGRMGDPNGSRWQPLENTQVMTDEGSREATRFYVNGLETTVKVRTVNGYEIEGTPQHRIKVLTAAGKMEWRRLGEVREGDTVPVLLDHQFGDPQHVLLPPLGEQYWNRDHKTDVPRQMSVELAEVVGYFMGDGSLHAKGLRFCVDKQDQDVVDHLVRAGKSLFNIEAKTAEMRGYTEVSFHSVPLATWWEACGFAKHRPDEGHTGKGWVAHIPDSILQTNDRAIYAGFLRGLFEADGTHMGHGQPAWSTAHRSFARDVHTMLSSLGIYARIAEDVQPRWGRNTMTRVLAGSHAHSVRWVERIGFLSERKTDKSITELNPNGSPKKDRIPITRAICDRLAPEVGPERKNMLDCLRRNGRVARDFAEELYARTGDTELGQLLKFCYDEVAVVEEGSYQATFDLSVPENVTYVANGFVSHNTISFAMACDTTGIEPDFALVKYKSLAGGGSMQIVNRSVDAALERLGYSEAARAQIISHIAETGTAEGAPGLAAEHLPVFDTAVGERAISAEGHVRMLGALQPFVSAGMSKTVNLPAETTVSEIEDLHQMAHDLGVKCIAVYRDGSKLSQVLTAKSDAPEAALPAIESAEATIDRIKRLLTSPTPGVSPETFYAQFGLKGAPRFTLASSRLGRTFEVKVGGTKVFLRTGEYEDGSLGEIFIDLAKEGATLRGVISCFAMAVSHGLQTGIPLRKLVDQFTFQTFEPRGMVERHDHVKMANSIVDAVFRILAVHYLHDDSLAQVKLDEGQPKLLDVAADPETGSAGPSAGQSGGGQVNGDRSVGDFDPDRKSKVRQTETGEACAVCGGQMVRTGTCTTCLSCGSVSGGC